MASEPAGANLFPQSGHVSRFKRGRIVGGQRAGFRGCTVWFTGLSAAGKTTLATELEEFLADRLRIPAYVLDGDNIRRGLCSDLDFSPTSRKENIRRVAEVAKLLADSGMICLTSFISPYRNDRQLAKEIHEASGLQFFECHVATSLEVCEQRDPKGLYRKARSGELRGFTGVDSEYEPPLEPRLSLQAGVDSIDACVEQLVRMLEDSGIVPMGAHTAERRAMTPEAEVPPSPKVESVAAGNETAPPHEAAAAMPAVDDEVVELFVTRERYQDACNEAQRLCAAYRALEVSELDVQWLQVLAEGWASPLRSFMSESELLDCLRFSRLATDDALDGGIAINQSVPIVLPVQEADRARLEGVPSVALTYRGRPLAIARGFDFFPHRIEERCCLTFSTGHADHPHAALIRRHGGEWLLGGGQLDVLDRIRWNDSLDEYRLTPRELRERFRQLDADAVFAFQLRNPIHNGHALLMRDTREQLLKLGKRKPCLLLHPLGGWTKEDDVPLKVMRTALLFLRFFKQLLISLYRFAFVSTRPCSTRGRSSGTRPCWPYFHRRCCMADRGRFSGTRALA